MVATEYKGWGKERFKILRWLFNSYRTESHPAINSCHQKRLKEANSSNTKNSVAIITS